MVLQRTIDNLRERPRDERAAVATGISLSVVIILFLGWAAFFVHELRASSTVSNTTTTQTTPASTQQVNAATGSNENAATSSDQSSYEQLQAILQAGNSIQ